LNLHGVRLARKERQSQSMKPAQQTGRASCLLSHSYSSVSLLYALLIALSVVMFASYGAFAGEQIDNDLVAPAPSASHFRSNEISVGVFGNYLDTYGENHQGIGDHALGGGLEASYFYFKYLGLSVDGDAFNEIPGDNFGGTVTGNLILRLPLDDYLPNFHLAPYLFGGAGRFYSERVGLPSSMPGVQRYVGRSGILADVGGGIEYRFNPNLGIFADARYNFAANSRNDFITTRAGIRYALPIFGQKSVDEETPPNNKTPIIETENGGEHQNWAIHFDAVEVIQGQPGFHSPYEGPQSLFPNDNFRQTSDVDLFFAFRVWPGGEIYFNPEYYQGFGFAEAHGLAAFSNAQAYKTGQFRGDFNIPHIFLRQVLGFGGEQEQLDADTLQLPGKVDISRLTLQVGRFAAPDLFDNNDYAHDGRGDFLNWAAVDALVYDYAQDALGYTEGLTLELNQKAWAARWGIFTIASVPDGSATDGQYLRAWQQEAELEGRYTLWDHPGKVRLLGYLMSASMGSYKAAVVDYPRGMPDLADTRRYRYSYGIVLNVQQEIIKDLGGFLRLGLRDPNYEAYQFSDATRSLEIGLSLKGSCWHRPNDTVGMAEMLSGIGHAEKEYLNDGGLGIEVGDGKLPHYGPENAIETYYDCELFKGINVALDYQLVAVPAFNKDRGPINIFSARLHVKF
jgi:high affinity Mn2+ porin